MRKMYYIDTNIVLSYNFTTEETHLRAFNLIRKIKKSTDEFYISPLTILELYCVVSRNINKYTLPPIALILFRSDKDKVEYIIKYSIQRLNLKICQEINTNSELENLNIEIFSEYQCAIKLSPRIKLRSLDMLHIAYAFRLRKEGKIKYIVSLDKEIRERKLLIKNITDINLISRVYNP